MQQCPNCGHPNRAGVVFCENCGASLIGKMPLDTKSLNTASSTEEQSQSGIETRTVTDAKVQGTSTFQAGDALKLDIEGSPEPIIFEPKEEAIFGRRDPATGAMPDVDLTPFAGYRMGVSRRHAAIRRNDETSLDVWDLGSSNGTFLNGQRLSAHRPYRLHDGDELRLGQMMIRISFESKTLSESTAVTTSEEAPEAPAQAAPVPGGNNKPQDQPVGAAQPPEEQPSAQPDAAQPSEKQGDAQPPESAAPAEQQEPKTIPPAPKTGPVPSAMQPSQPPKPPKPSPQAAEQTSDAKSADAKPADTTQPDEPPQAEASKPDKPDEQHAGPATDPEPDTEPPASEEEKRD